MDIHELTFDDYVLSTDRSRLDIDTVCAFLRRSHWAAQRKRATIEKCIEHSLCYGIYHKERQVAFARVVTDYATFAYLCDVFVDEEYRGRGLSKKLMSCIMQHPDLTALRRFILATKDAHGLYEQFGFRPLSAEEQRRYKSILKDGI